MRKRRFTTVRETLLLFLRQGLLLSLCLLLGVSAPLSVCAEHLAQQVVRVGWYESPFNATSPKGRRSGYAYEYQQKIAAYTGWKYQYVKGSWPELLEMLKAGEIDLMSDVSFTEERSADMLFSSYPMGAETYYVFIDEENTEIKPGESSTLQGKKVGVNKNSSEFFFAVNKSRRDLLNELDSALGKIQDENRFYNQQMYDKYVSTIGTNTFLPPDEVDWLSSHGPIRVGYRDNYLPFCGTDSATGELTGDLHDYLELASQATKNVHTEFTAVPYPTVDAALDALKAGEIDCVFPVNLSAHDEEELGVSVTTPLMETEMYAAVRKADHLRDLTDGEMTVAVNEGNANYEAFLNDYFPNWNKLYCTGAEAGFQAV